MSMSSVVSSFLWGIALLTHDGQLVDDFPRRNPFVTSSISIGCPKGIIDEENMLLSWQMSGVIGKGENSRVWLQTSINSWIIARPQTALPLSYWRLQKIESGTVTFVLNDSVSNECYDERFIEFNLKDK